MANYPADLAREIMADAGAPDVVMLGPERTHRTRKRRKLPCGHTVEPGTLYRVQVGLVDGEFFTDCQCDECYASLFDGEPESDLDAP